MFVGAAHIENHEIAVSAPVELRSQFAQVDDARGPEFCSFSECFDRLGGRARDVVDADADQLALSVRDLGVTFSDERQRPAEVGDKRIRQLEPQ